MKPASVRAKGQNGERDVCAFLQLGVDEVYQFLKMEAPKMHRNLQQTQSGGFDIAGLPWIAIEVKHHAKTTKGLLAEWWNQTLRQAGDTFEPVLFYRSNGNPFRVRMFQTCIVADRQIKLLVDISTNDFMKWFRWRLFFELGKK